MASSSAHSAPRCATDPPAQPTESTPFAGGCASHDFRSLATNGGMRQFNVAILGARRVGKSALTDTCILCSSRWIYLLLTDRFVTVRDVFLKFFVTTGVEQFTAFTEVYIKSCLGFVLANSLTQEGSLKEVESLRNQIFRIKGSENVPIVVVGTKSDLVSEREVPTTTIETLASRWNLPFYETSAKRNWHINDIFEDLLRQMRVRYYPDAAKKAKKMLPEGPCIIM
ncbi:P-loop containing nucleoside triphosphate hydrolase protein [Mycena albidolilacea]|uniref:P-loop containing nucleoside triphosphate hydrolase protein n=1 Tax=Mycena albidolilacea TaxID=1033008 RepID=A0AAD7EVY0_9AGAR|nr:P-loop containing nucleoside triphosphate hydrolase protein [Mycena albidolilacea]